MNVGPTRTSTAGLAFIAREEGVRLEPYNDANGFATIGYGHLLHRSRVTAADLAQWKGFTEDAALVLLREDLRTAERAVLRLVRPPFLFQNRFDALVSFTFNCGEGNLERSTLLKRLNSGRRRKGAADEFRHWVKGSDGHVIPGLVGRRARECRLFRFRRYS